MKVRAKKRDNKIAVAAMALGAFAACQPISARADDTSVEIRLLKERLKQLEERVAEQGRKEKATQEKLRQQAAQQPAPPPGPAGPAPMSFLQASAFRRSPRRVASPQPRQRFAAHHLGLPRSGLKSHHHAGGFLALESVTRSAFLGAISDHPATRISLLEMFLPATRENSVSPLARAALVADARRRRSGKHLAVMWRRTSSAPRKPPIPTKAIPTIYVCAICT